jgi:hypothetical protein
LSLSLPAFAAGGTDPGACDPTSNPCKVKSLQTSPVGFGALPTCNAGRAATIRGTTDAGYRACDNGVWGPLGGGAGGTSTCTGASCLVNDGGLFYGPVRSSFTEAGSTGTGHANFDCLNNPSASSPCLANFTGAMEIGGRYGDGTVAGYDTYIGGMHPRSAGGWFCVLSNYGSADLPDGGSGGVERCELAVEWNGDVKIGSNLYLGQDGAAGRVFGNNLYWTSTGPTTFWNNTTGDVIDWYAGAGATQVGGVTAGGVVASKGLAIGGDPATAHTLCSSTAPTIASGFGTGATVNQSNGSCSFSVVVGTSSSSSGTVTLSPAATNGWSCWCSDVTTKNNTHFLCKQTGDSTTSATFTLYASDGTATAFVDNDRMYGGCTGR